MTFVHAMTTPGQVPPSRRVVRAQGAGRVALAAVGLVAWTMTLAPSLAMPLQSATMATALLVATLPERALTYKPELHRRHHVRGVDGTHNAGSVLVLWDQSFGAAASLVPSVSRAAHHARPATSVARSRRSAAQ